MSYGIVPNPAQLLAAKRQSAETKLNCPTAVTPADDLYTWAEQIITQLHVRGDHNPKLSLAQALDIPYDPCWRGSTLPARDEPRHRVVARFAREGLIAQIWSYNWDCVQEAALERVGIKRNGPGTTLPWAAGFHTVITAADVHQAALENAVTVIKPHGCVEALDRANDATNAGRHVEARALAARFRLTASELASTAPNVGDGVEQFFFASLAHDLCTRPWIIAGWSASEPYITQYVDQSVRPVLSERPLLADELSIIDPYFNANGHSFIAQCYGKTPQEVHISTSAPYSTDQLFLWLQTLYALHCVRIHSSATTQAALLLIEQQLAQAPDTPPYTFSWADNFLSVWVRLCWRSGVVPCRGRDGAPIEPEDVPLESGRDEHIPWHLNNIPRPDLAAAAYLIQRLEASGRGGDWDYEMFPGGLFSPIHAKLVIPVPVWNIAQIDDLRGLKALIEAVAKQGAGFIATVTVLFMHDQENGTLGADQRRAIRDLVATNFPIAQFSQADNIEEAELATF